MFCLQILFVFKISQEMSSRKTAGRRGTTKKRAQRATSNVFAMFNQDQIQEFKEAFNMIDQVGKSSQVHFVHPTLSKWFVYIEAS
jgi:hypothetical protein